MNRHLFFYFSLIFSEFTFASERYKGVDLWLPQAFQHEYTKLLNAADKVKEALYCDEILSGSINESVSTLDHIHFVFKCRTKNRHTFPILVDGNTLALVNEYGDQQLKLEEENRLRKELDDKEKARIEELDVAAKQKTLNEEEARILAENVSQRRREQSQYWQICRHDIRKRLKNFNQVKILSDSLPEPLIQADQFTYTVVFDSLSPSRKILHFQVDCVISALDNYVTKVSPRKDIIDK